MAAIELKRSGLALALGFLLAVSLWLSLLLPPRAGAMVYWVNGNGTIGRADLDGSGADQDFITVAGPLSPSTGLAVSRRHVFWCGGNGFVGRARLDGTGVDRKFIAMLPGGGDGELSIAGGRIYWVNDEWIGRANLDGTGIRRKLLAPQSSYVRGLSVLGGEIYWSDYQNSRIGNGELDPFAVNPLFIQPTADNPEGIAANSSHVYWSNGSAGAIGRARRNGTGIDQNFVSAAYAYGVEVNRRHVFWADYGINSIGRARLDGTAVDQSFINGALGPEGLAVDWIRNTGAGLRIVKAKRNALRGTAKLIVKLPGPGRLVLGGKGLKRVGKSVRKARARLPVHATGALKRRLAVNRIAKARVRIRFSPDLSRRSRVKAETLILRRRG